MSITLTTYQQRIPEITATFWEHEVQAEEMAAWCNGEIKSSTTMQIPNLVDGNEGYLAEMPCYIIEMDGRYVPVPQAEFESAYTSKLL